MDATDMDGDNDVINAPSCVRAVSKRGDDRERAVSSVTLTYTFLSFVVAGMHRRTTVSAKNGQGRHLFDVLPRKPSLNEAMAGPAMWLCFSFTIIHVTIALWGALRFSSLIGFCQAVNQSKRYPYVKTVLLVTLVLYIPLSLIAITLMWVGYNQDWAAGFFFLILPFFSIVGFVAVVLVTRNDVSNYIDILRAARSKLPFQPLPPPLAVGIGASPPRSAAVSMPPPLPVRDGNVVDDDDAF